MSCFSVFLSLGCSWTLGRPLTLVGRWLMTSSLSISSPLEEISSSSCSSFEDWVVVTRDLVTSGLLRRVKGKFLVLGGLRRLILDLIGFPSQ